MSPRMAPEPSGIGDFKPERRERHQQYASRPTTAGTGAQHLPHTTKHPRAGGLASPMPSILLDPHYQPSTSGFRTLSRPRTRSRFRQGGGHLTDPVEDDEEDLPEAAHPSEGITTSERIAHDSNLGESWKTTRAGAVEEDDDVAEGAREVGAEKGAGVLGLIYQFQKAQTEGRGTGVNI